MNGLRRGGWLLSGAAVVLFGLAFFLPPGEERHVFVIAAWAVLGTAFGLVLNATPTGDPAWLSQRGRWPGVIIVGALVVGSLIATCGMQQFGGFDHSALIDLAWRLANGQHPYRDFPCPAPIGFVLGAGYSFQLFGTQWRALVWIDAIFAMFTFAWSCLLLARLLGERRRAWLLAFSAQATTTVLAAYWWYNPVTTMGGLLFFLAAAVWLRFPQDRFAQVSYAVALCFLAGLKPNVAGLLIVGTTLVLLTSREHRWRTLIWSAAAAAVFIGWLALHGLHVPDMLANYLGIASRGFTLRQFLQDMSWTERWLSMAAAGALFAAFVAALRPVPGDHSRMRALAVVAGLAGYYGFVTNGESKLVDLTMVLFGAVVFAQNRPKVIAYLGALTLIFAGTGLGVAVTRHRVRAIGPGVFFEYRTAPIDPPTAFFKGLESGPRLVIVASDVAKVMDHAPEQARVWFGPRMQWGYAAFHRPPPVGQPSWWHPGVAFPAADEAKYRADWFAQRFDMLIFLRGDATYLAPDFLAAINEHYTYVPSPPSLTLLRRKPQP